MNNIYDTLYQIGMVPVIKIDDAKDAIPLAKALCDGGIPCAEVTFRTDAAYQAIKNMSENVPEILVGAGTVLSIEQAKLAIEAGAKFIVSPGLNPEVVKYCQSVNVPILPGCITPTEIELALSFGLNVLKFFPAEQAGGLDFTKAVCAPYTQIKFIPTGGISEKNLEEYLKFDKIVACGGSYMATTDLINNGKWDEVTEICKKTVEKIKKVRN
ncbi:MAG: bifunctional 4-hydroxy-2-oxoglutarate aldolase/2-dehydro-3-deoxy-phosphogluconate aldolase [Defluviitaleaceae bacterium]|nr:bifunctional 4-hydroxy-2-oxoglutarate aldolase/2-dehydro-3-deoxy-phosphogluconate aldolase [Defluviitaleaceae bacterium]